MHGGALVVRRRRVYYKESAGFRLLSNSFKRMSSTGKLVIGVIVVVLIGLGFWYYSANKGGTAPAAPGSSASPSDAGVLPTSASDNSDAALNQDTAAVDTQLNGLNSDSATVDSSINDKPVQ